MLMSDALKVSPSVDSHICLSHTTAHSFKFKVVKITNLEYLTFTSDEPNLDKSHFINDAIPAVKEFKFSLWCTKDSNQK